MRGRGILGRVTVLGIGAACVLATWASAASVRQAGLEPEPAALFQALGLRQEEREECLALALARAMSGDCEAGLDWIDAAAGAGGTTDEFGRRLALERERLKGWIALRDEFLGELSASQKALALELDGKRVTSAFTREGGELVLAKGGKRVAVRALRPEALVAEIPKERLSGAREWLKVYPYCVTANPKWKRLTTEGSAAAELKRDAQDFYPRMAALAPAVERLDRLAATPPPVDAAGARAVLSEVEGLLALRAEACVTARLAALGTLVEQLLVQIGAAMGVADLTRAKVTEPTPGTSCMAYDFADEAQGLDWLRDDEYLSELRQPLEAVASAAEETRFAPGPKGFSGNGAFGWRHALEFLAPLRVRYQVRWEPYEGKPGKVFAFALGMMADADGRHLRVHELGFLYVDELDGPYVAVRPKGDATVQLGQTYALELVHDGRKVEVWVDGVLRAEASAERRLEGRVFLWGHSDLCISLPKLEIEGRVTPASLARAREHWVRQELARRELALEAR